IAATSDNKTGIAGVASPVDVKIMVLKIHGGSDKKGSIASAVKAVKYAQAMGADICNLSWGTYGDCPSLLAAIKQSNMLFVCAAGNDGTNNDQKPLYPASFDLDNVISVGYTDWNGELSTKSNFGKTTVDIAVPSVHVYSTTVGGYDYMSGSSMAAPHVTGLAALVYSYGDGITAKAVKNLLTKNVKKRPELAGSVKTGGIASASSIFAKNPSFEPDFTNPTLQVTRTFDKDKLMLKIDAKDTGSGVHSVRYFVGDKSLKDFAHGTAGTFVDGKKLSLSKGGYLTFYVDDRAGNEIAKIFYLSDDEIKPVYSDVSFSVDDSYKSITVNGKVKDADSGIKTVKYLQGTHSVSDFSAAGTTVEFKKSGKFTFDVAAPGQYTIFASDWRGNKEVFQLLTKIVRAESLTLSREKKTLTKGKAFKIKYEIAPADTTDKIKFTSSDEKVATVSAKGKVTAVGRGSCTITVTTSSGLEKVIEIRVKKAKP
ncbi:MAG: S8 family serine peptidase, partial [Lachnospiraceae bacterium]|nr:S8 family serine peptidase [Lachnospiraceae bacterium]